LEETYNLRGVTPSFFFNSIVWLLEETYNLRGVTPQYYDVNGTILVGTDL